MQGDLQHEIIHLFRCTDQVLKRAIGRKVEGTGLYRSQHRLLMILGKHPDCSQTAIAEKMEISPPAVRASSAFRRWSPPSLRDFPIRRWNSSAAFCRE